MPVAALDQFAMHTPAVSNAKQIAVPGEIACAKFRLTAATKNNCLMIYERAPSLFANNGRSLATTAPLNIYTHTRCEQPGAKCIMVTSLGTAFDAFQRSSN